MKHIIFIFVTLILSLSGFSQPFFREVDSQKTVNFNELLNNWQSYFAKIPVTTYWSSNYNYPNRVDYLQKEGQDISLPYDGKNSFRKIGSYQVKDSEIPLLISFGLVDTFWQHQIIKSYMYDKVKFDVSGGCEIFEVPGLSDFYFVKLEINSNAVISGDGRSEWANDQSLSGFIPAKSTIRNSVDILPRLVGGLPPYNINVSFSMDGKVLSLTKRI